MKTFAIGVAIVALIAACGANGIVNVTEPPTIKYQKYEPPQATVPAENLRPPPQTP